MSILNVDTIRDAAGTGAPDFPNGITTTSTGLEPTSMVEVHTGNGSGSTATSTRRFSTTKTNVGSDITYTDSATNGATFTVNADGIYAISYSDAATGAAENIGISLNASSGATSFTSLSMAQRVIGAVTPAANFQANVGAVIRLVSGDIIRAHHDGSANSTSSKCQFIITQVVKL